MKLPLLPSAVIVMLLAAGACAPSATASITPPLAYVMIPGVVVDPGRCVVYMMNPSHAIDAVQVSSGALLWSTTAAAKPLTLAGSRLVAQSEPYHARVLKLVILDTLHGGAVALRTQMPLPEGVTALIDQGIGTSFDLQARLRGDGVEVTWRFSSRRIGGIAMRGGLSNAVERGGTALIDLKTGRVSPLPLDRFAGERRAPSVAISADGNFAMTSKRGAADAWGLPSYAWQIRERARGNVLGEMPSTVSYAPFFVCRRVLVYRCPPIRRLMDGNRVEQPLTLRAFDFRSHSEVWAKPLRDIAMRGPSPPSS